jgi:hypothetical protein
MPQAFLTSLLALFVLTPAIALAAPAKKAAPAPATRQADGQATLFGNANGPSMASLKGLSVFAAYDFADQLESSNGKTDTERAFDIGAMYEFSQFSPGLGAQLGAEYDFSRATKPPQGAQAVKYSQFAPFAEVVGHLTPRLKVTGGLNYNFPSADNLNGATLKGNVGYQFGASFALNQHIAFDARYRSMQYDVSGNGQSTSLKQNGFQMAGRFMF